MQPKGSTPAVKEGLYVRWFVTNVLILRHSTLSSVAAVVRFGRHSAVACDIQEHCACRVNRLVNMAAIQGQCAKTHLPSKAFLGDAGFAGARHALVQQRGSLQVL